MPEEKPVSKIAVRDTEVFTSLPSVRTVPGSFIGIPVVVDPRIPEGVAELRDQEGTVIEVVNIG